MSPIEPIDLLNQMFSQFDRLAEKHGLEKIKTIGDAYMVAGGLPVPRTDHAEAIAAMALEIQEVMKQFAADMNEPFQIRIGINTGPVVAGVIGIKKFLKLLLILLTITRYSKEHRNTVTRGHQFVAQLTQKVAMAAARAIMLFPLCVGTARAAIFNPSTGHYYDFVSGSFTWSEARDAAASSSFNGSQGYLVTITSEAENDFIVNNLILPNFPVDSRSAWGWIGASDAAIEGDWQWVTGPEAGTAFWLGNAGGSPVGGAYSNWEAAEPNAFLNEHYAHIFTATGFVGQWNDFPNSERLGYYVEYGGLESESIPEPSSVFGLLALGAIGAGTLLKRKR